MEAILRHYTDTARHLSYSAVASNIPEAERYPGSLWKDGLGRTLLMKLLISAPKLSPSSLGKPNIFNSSNTRHWIASIENYVEAQGILQDEN